jgi:phage terminase large subunit
VTTATIKLPPKLVPLFSPERGALRFRVAHGGRGSGKSFTFALMAAVWGYAEPLRILCTREMQNSIKDSMHAEIKNAIQSMPWLEQHYEIGEAYIRGKNGTEFLFKGLRHNISSIKSMAQIDLCIVEEAADIPQHSWQALLPTIRAARSEIWCVYNPKDPTDPVDEMFRKDPPPRSHVVELNWNDNPWFPAELNEQRKHAQTSMNPADYAWIWEGQYLQNSDAQVFHGKIHIEDIEPSSDWGDPYLGGDWGFSQDPTAAVACWVRGDDLIITHEAVKIGLELDDTAEFVKAHIPNFDKYASRWDSARPESISHVKRHGLPRAEAVSKWSGSVEDGIQFLRSFKRIIIHPRCKQMITEARLYSYKVDRLTGLVTSKIIDDNNHCWDAVRYALAPMIKKQQFIFEV